MATNDETYMSLVNLRSRLASRQTELKRDLEVVTKQLESVSVTLELIDVPLVPTPEGGEGIIDLLLVSPSPASGIDIGSLQGMTQQDALKKIAEHFGGQFYTTVAKKLLLQAGLIKNPQNANNILFSVIQRSGAFDRVSRGLYRLINKPVRPERSISA